MQGSTSLTVSVLVRPAAVAVVAHVAKRVIAAAQGEMQGGARCTHSLTANINLFCLQIPFPQPAQNPATRTSIKLRVERQALLPTGPLARRSTKLATPTPAAAIRPGAYECPALLCMTLTAGQSGQRCRLRTWAPARRAPCAAMQGKRRLVRLEGADIRVRFFAAVYRVRC